ncbi:metallophosphoesterase family protein [Paenibacillus silvisoli]|uniref:metallophosphoesterase family protein n=1 Tax=Paenibacillus silvisoli TaxID=3110539 RepID=UPI002803D1C4|nr:metallophosphoesterase [Paenibacillus silvisoli]
MFRFAVMSDIHVQAWDQESQARLVSALHDYAFLPEPPDYIVINGDLTEGHDSDYTVLLHLLETHATCPVYMTMGNHEYYRMWYKQLPTPVWSMATFPNEWSSEQAMELFLSRLKLSRPYYAERLQGYTFIFLAGECYRDQVDGIVEHAWISDEQFAFLEKQLEQKQNDTPGYNGRPVFVFLHQPIEEVFQKERLAQLLAAYPEIIFFSGHTHHQLTSRQTYTAPEGRFAIVNSSSVRRPWSDRDEPLDGSMSESLFVEVQDDKVIISGRRHDERDWVAQAKFVRSYAKNKKKYRQKIK